MDATYDDLARAEWEKSAAIRVEIEICEYVIMPNHVHAIVRIIEGRGDRPVARTEDRPVAPTMPDTPTENGPGTRTHPNGPTPKSIGAFVAGFKSAATVRINQIRQTPGAPVWQRNYWEHVIRDEQSYQTIAAYILNNPARWEQDQLFRIG